jgi:localization factor PodJL
LAGNLPWSIKGVSAEAREAAKQAARSAGLPLGLWLSRVIREVAAQEAAERGPPATAAPVEPPHAAND